ncbi:alpha/beta fold hydrolase [Methylobacterium sp. WL30]|uniref:alpha/beta fold hydrolase n=1 Tax=unclassified Methylobacterium TaxID=2615210 RepID=UPI0011C6EA10|nr:MULTISPECIES: alpha/beta fold hydrolase [unclassified Methylobacterium]TXN40563.1 alpha/beta fold hydrolase [Methylobacterium sp. WL93]TXN49662.1 alpha/beta fold hydrolase [Methylobacterium sp. WL119]TXN62918.1 alpha/beta fold hydrolase [Methylobacterium sp. WL30]
MRIALAGGRISAQELGAGEPLVLFHSLLADAASFDRIAEPLAERFRVIVTDLPGFGASESVSGGLEAVADRMAEALRDLGRRPTVLGNGFGGFVALQMAIRHPGLVSRLVLADCGACFSEQGRQAFRNMAAISREKGLSALSETAMRRLFAPEFQQANPVLMQERLAAFLRTDPTVFRAACDALAELDLRPDLRAVDVPVLVLVGEQDEATPPPMSRELAAGLPDARLTILSGCAHVPQLQEPQRFLRELATFLDEEIAAADFFPTGG